VHGKFRHEETLATLSHSQKYAPTVVVKDLAEAGRLSALIRGDYPPGQFYQWFEGKYSERFDPQRDLQRIAVVNQTTMLASETADISDHFRQVMIDLHGEENIDYRVANTRDTLCYATKNNQSATLRLLEEQADLAIVIGGRNSSNTSHLVELCEQHLPTYFIASERDIHNQHHLLHYDFHRQKERNIFHFLPEKRPLRILLTSGASCPDAIVEHVLMRLLGFFPYTRNLEEVLAEYEVVPA